MVRRKQIRQIVERLLADQGIMSAPIPIEKVAESHGPRVVRSPADDDLSGFIYRDAKNDVTVIGVNETHHPNRQAFTIAHELGHHLLHDLEDVHVDRGFSVKLRSRKASEGTSIEEKEANLFAAEILMPTEFLEKDLRDVEDVDLVDEGVIAALARRYRVSTQAMTFRLAYLGYINQ